MTIQIQPNEKQVMICLVNMYMAGIHAGIQSLHAVGEMMILHPDNSRFKAWLGRDKTVKILNGGTQSNIRWLRDAIISASGYYGMEIPTSVFHEGEDELNGALTCCAMVLPTYSPELNQHTKDFIQESDNILDRCRYAH